MTRHFDLCVCCPPAQHEACPYVEVCVCVGGGVGVGRGIVMLEGTSRDNLTHIQ